MTEKIALIGSVNTEEILADTIRTQSPDVIIDGYELFQNEAYGRSVDGRYKLYKTNHDGETMHDLSSLDNLRTLGYTAINLGPLSAPFFTESKLSELEVDYIGPRINELNYELDKTRIFDVFPDESAVLPPTVLLEKSDTASIEHAISQLDGEVVLKFIGEYSNYYSDSETRRVRMLDEFENMSELQNFIANSISSGGKALLQRRIVGQQFSYTALTDGDGGIFRLGENICYKHRFDGETGPLCDGTGSISIDNTLPGLIDTKDIDYIEREIVSKYISHLDETLGRKPKTFLNIDLIKDSSGKIHLLEINNREPGGHTTASLLSGLETPLIDVFQAAQEERLRELTPRFKQGAAIVVSAYPKNFPQPFPDKAERPEIIIPKLKTDDKVKIYTGWVDVKEDRQHEVLASANLSPAVLFSTHTPTMQQSRTDLYERMQRIVTNEFDFRRDIGL